MSWPSSSDYQDALQNPNLSFFDPSLKGSKPILDNLGLPKAISGSFAIVFPVISNGKMYAVRCFLMESHERQKKYNYISTYLKKLNLKYMVEFDYIEKGIRIRNNWFPILKMEWINGVHLNDYIKININESNKIIALEKKFLEMITTLNKNKIAHGDLHHLNILIKDDEFKLIDYDAMFVPGLDGLSCGEVGHRNYQHPLRTENDYGPYLDNFSAWEILLSLKILSCDKNFWNISGAGEEYILFKQQDFDDASSSKLFASLQNIKNESIKGLILEFESIIYSSILSEIPYINEEELGKYKYIDVDQMPSEEEGRIEQSEWIFEHLPVKQLSLNTHLLRERILAVLLIIINSFNLYGIYQTIYSSIVGIGILIGGFSILFYLYFLSYKKVSIVVEKKTVQNNIKINKDNIDSINSQIVKYKNTIKKINLSEKSEIETINITIINNKKEEREYLIKIEGELTKQLQILTQEYSRTLKEETEEINNYLFNFKENYVNQQLSRRTISGASISGVGPALTSRLKRAGFNTAADIKSVDFINTRIIHKSGGGIHIPGIGPKTLENIRYWHNELKRYYESMAPAPPAEEIAKIKSKYAFKMYTINENKSKAKEQNERMKITKITYIKNANDNLNKQIQRTKVIKMNEKKTNFEEIKTQEKLLVPIKWKYAELLHELESYQNITYGNYLKKIVSIK